MNEWIKKWKLRRISFKALFLLSLLTNKDSYNTQIIQRVIDTIFRKRFRVPGFGTGSGTLVPVPWNRFLRQITTWNTITLAFVALEQRQHAWRMNWTQCRLSVDSLNWRSCIDHDVLTGVRNDASNSVTNFSKFVWCWNLISTIGGGTTMHYVVMTFRFNNNNNNNYSG